MRKMRKSILAVILSIAVTVTMIPAFAFAETPQESEPASNAEMIVKAIDKDVPKLVVGETLAIDDQAELFIDGEKSNKIKWEIIGETGTDGEDADVIGYTDETCRVLKAKAPGAADVWAYAEDSMENGVLFRVEVYESKDAMAKEPYSGSSEAAYAAKGKMKTKSKSTSKDSNPVARLTIIGYPGNAIHLMPHGFLALQTYKDLDLNVSYFTYYKPNKKYTDLMEDYAKNPGKYKSDPALYNNNALGLEDRGSYFDEMTNGKHSDPAKVSLKAGESITIGKFTDETRNLESFIKMLEDSSISSSIATATFIKQLKNYAEKNGLVDINQLVAGGIVTILKAYRTVLKTGHNPIDAEMELGGLFINREMRNQFTGTTDRHPNNYYTVEITADELDGLKNYLSDKNNNEFSFLNENCSNAASSIWNAALFDKPELHVKANYSGFTNDPVSLYVELGIMRSKTGLEGYGGTDFTPRTLAYKTESKDSEPSKQPAAKKANPMTVKGKTAAVKYNTLKKNSKTIKRSKVLTVKNAKGTVTYKKLSGKAKITIKKKNGNVTVKKGLKKGLYNVKVRVTAAGNSQYKAVSKTATFKIKVK